MAVPNCGPTVVNNATANAACISPSTQFGIMDDDSDDDSWSGCWRPSIPDGAVKKGRNDEMYSPKLMTFHGCDECCCCGGGDDDNDVLFLLCAISLFKLLQYMTKSGFKVNM